MANTIKIKAGSGTPTTSNIVDRELAFDRSANKLYINDNGSIVDLSGEVGDITAVTAGTGLDGGGSSGDVSLSVDVSDFMTNGSDNRILTATGTDAMNAEANLTFDGSHLRLPNSSSVIMGASDAFVINHNGSHNYIQNTKSDADVYFTVNDGGSTINALIIDSSEVANIVLPNDGQKLLLGASNDFQFYHDGTNSVINNTTGDLQIYNNADNKDIVLLSDDGSGGTTAYLTLDGSETLIAMHKNTYWNDGVRQYMGSHSDQYMYYDGTDNIGYWRATTGDIVIRTEENDHDIRFQTDDGSGGIDNYMVIDGGATSIDLLKDTRLAATKKLYLDGGGNTYIDEPSGDQLRLVAGGTEVLKGYSSGVIDIYGGSINRSIELGANRTGDAASYIDFIGDTTYTDYGFRVIRNGGANAITQLLHRGTGELQLTTQEAGLIRFRTAGADRYLIDGSGNHSIYGDTSFSSPMLVQYGVVINEGGHDSDTRIEGDTDTNLVRVDAGNDRVGIGTGSPGNKFTVNSTGTHQASIQYDASTRLRISVESSGKARLYTDNNANVGIESGGLYVQPTNKFYLDGGSHTYISESANDLLDVYVGGTNLLRLEESGTDSVFTTDNVHLAVGTHKDLRIYHNSSSSNNNIENHSGSLYITNEVNDADIIFRSDDGSGGVTPYLTLDGSATFTHLHQNTGLAEGKKLYFDGGSDTYITSDSADFMQCFVGGVEAFRILESSSVAYFYAPDNAFLGAGTSIDFTMSHDGTNSQFVNNTGHLYIRNNADDKDIIFQVDDGGGNNITALQIDASNAGTATFSHDILLNAELSAIRFGASQQGSIYEHSSDIVVSNSAAGNDTIFENLNSAGDTYVKNLFIDGSTSRIGIGTTSPSFKLKVNVDNGTYTDMETIAAFQSKRGADTEYEAGIMINSMGDCLAGSISSNLYWTDNVMAKGNTGRSGGAFQIDNSASNESQFLWRGTPYNSTTLTNYMMLDNTQSLQVLGDVVAYSTSVSDKRLKDNVETIDNALEKVMKLRGVEFDWIGASRKGQHDIGLIAQEVEEVIPEIVREKEFKVGEFTDNKQTFKTVDYDKMVGVLIEAIKEQQVQIDELKTKIGE